MAFDITILGTSSGMPTEGRNTSACAVRIGKEIVLFDCGEGTLTQFRRAGLKASRIRNIFLTHLHGDHVNGLPTLLSAMSLRGAANSVRIFGPPGLNKYIETMLGLKVTEPTFTVSVVVQQMDARLGR